MNEYSYELYVANNSGGYDLKHVLCVNASTSDEAEDKARRQNYRLYGDYRIRHVKLVNKFKNTDGEI